MFTLYNLLFSVLIPIWFPIVYLRARKRKVMPIWEQKWGNLPLGYKKGDRRVWIHAVSVGEVLALTPVLRQLRSLLPTHEFILSVTTSSGHATAEQENEKKAGLYDHLVYFPFDLARPMLAAMQRARPDVVAVMETELWPSFFWGAKVFTARTMLINGRISDRSFPRARAIRFFYKMVFKNLDQCLMQSQVDAERITVLGAKSAEVLGNCKFDQALPANLPSGKSIRTDLNIPDGAPVVVIGSTRGEEEETLVLTAIKDLPQWKSGALFVVHAPRHIERAEALGELAANILGAPPAMRSKGETGRYLILDTYGELAGIYAAADVAVVGGGFENLGGQNIIQPLAHGLPVIHGPHMQNFRSAAQDAAAAGATMVASTPFELTAALQTLLSDPERRSTMGAAAAALVKKNIGAGHRYAKAIADAATK